MNQPQTVCVTGANGFVGKALSKKLLDIGYQVNAVCRKTNQELEDLGAKVYLADISEDKNKLANAFENCDFVFHVASKVDMWGAYQDFYRANVVGTRNVIEACKLAKVKGLIYTSSPSVVADGNDLNKIDESYPIPKKHHASYPATKAIAEAEVIKSNSENFKTIALRPHLIFGPGDQHFIPTILERARQGRMLVVGNGNNIVDLCYIEDCVNAHILAMKAVERGEEASGKAFFISQDEPIKLWDFINQVLSKNGIAPLKRRVSKSTAICLASIFEFCAKISPISFKPLFTKFLVSEMTTNHYFDLSAAKKLLSYHPQYKLQEAIERTFH